MGKRSVPNSENMQIIQQLFTLSHSLKKGKLATSQTKVYSALRLSLLLAAGHLQRTSLRKKLIISTILLYLAPSYADKPASVVLNKKRCRTFDIFCFSRKEGDSGPICAVFLPLIYVSHTADNTLHDGISG